VSGGGCASFDRSLLSWSGLFCEEVGREIHPRGRVHIARLADHDVRDPRRAWDLLAERRRPIFVPRKITSAPCGSESIWIVISSGSGGSTTAFSGGLGSGGLGSGGLTAGSGGLAGSLPA